MKNAPPMDAATRRMYRVITWVSFLVVVAVTVYGVVEEIFQPGEPIGQSLVGINFPIPGYVAQPITYFSVASVAFWYCGLKLWEEKISRWPTWLLMFLRLFALVVAFSAAYEVLYNFIIWGALYSTACASAQCNPDLLSSQYPRPWNLVFATRAFLSLFVIGGYSVYYLRSFSNSE